ncbi:MAG: MarR family transcriptional regulator [Burkholderiales bacterium]
MGLTGTQFNILTTLERIDRPVSIGEMAAMMVLQTTNLSGIVSVLAKRGLLRCEPQRRRSRTSGRRAARQRIGHTSRITTAHPQCPRT